MVSARYTSRFLSVAATSLALVMALTCSARSAATPAPASTPSASTSSSSSGGNVAAGILVPAGTVVPVHIVGTLSSGSAKPDDVFQIQAAEDVVIEHMVVVRQGAGGQGHVVESDSAAGNGHSGAIGLAFDYLYSVDGGRIKLAASAQKQVEEDRKGASSTATIIGFATFGIGGLFGHNLAHGRQKKIDEKTIMSAFVSDNIHVHSSEQATEARYDK